jgi:hypothetical protein
VQTVHALQTAVTYYVRLYTMSLFMPDRCTPAAGALSTAQASKGHTAAVHEIGSEPEEALRPARRTDGGATSRK